MSRVFWDTNVYIYLLEDYGPWSALAANLRNKMLDRGDQLVTSTLTLGEILVKPTAAGDAELCRKYVQRLTSASLIIPFDRPMQSNLLVRVLRGLICSSPTITVCMANGLQASNSSCRSIACPFKLEIRKILMMKRNRRSENSACWTRFE